MEYDCEEMYWNTCTYFQMHYIVHMVFKMQICYPEKSIFVLIPSYNNSYMLDRACRRLQSNSPSLPKKIYSPFAGTSKIGHFYNTRVNNVCRNRPPCQTTVANLVPLYYTSIKYSLCFWNFNLHCSGQSYCLRIWILRKRNITTFNLKLK